MTQKTAPAREQWSGQYGFLLAAIGSAVGLGNIWRFPGVAYSKGGGAFLVPYLVALLFVGIPVLLFDYSIGHRFRGSAPTIFHRISRRAEWMGWFQVLICFVIMCYYAVIIAWAAAYAWFSVTKAWGSDAGTFFFSKFLSLPDSPRLTITPDWSVLAPLIGVWVVCLFIIARGVAKGLEKANRVFMPLLVVLFAALVLRAVFLPGALDGLTAFFTPNWAALTQTSVWMAAFAQVFYSLSVGFGIMMTYSSYLKRRANLGGTGFVAAFANSSFEILAGVGVFAALGFMAFQQEIPVGELKNISDVSLSFISFPTIVTMMPGGPIFGLLFFTSLVLAGLTSLTSLLQVVTAAVQEKFRLTATAAALAVGIPAALVSVLLFGTTSGLYSLDIVDKHINEIGIVFIAATYLLYASVGKKLLGELRHSLNIVSSVHVGRWWAIAVGYLIPAVLLYMLLTTAWSLLTDRYEGYPVWMLLTLGGGCLLFAALVTGILSLLRWRRVDNFTPLTLPAQLPPRPVKNGKEN